MSKVWEMREYTILAACKATVRDRDGVFTGWPRNAFAKFANVEWRWVVVVETERGLSWVIVDRKNKPPVGAKIPLSTSPHSGTPIGYRTFADLLVPAKVTHYSGPKELQTAGIAAGAGA